jgi:hypothetical protein
MTYQPNWEFSMSPTTQSILASIDQLPPTEQHQLMLEFLRRVDATSLTELMDDALVYCAEAVFLDLDREEAQLEAATL